MLIMMGSWAGPMPAPTRPVVGYSDRPGLEAAWPRLAHKRARLIRRYLIRRGIDPKRITASGRRFFPPEADQNPTDPLAQALRRRVELSLRQ